MHSTLLERFATLLKADSASVRSYLLDSEREAEVYYVPFEEVNIDAKLVLVGITPGPTQMNTAHRVAGVALRGSLPAAGVLRKAKQTAAFDGMRPRINEMLDHFMIPQKLGLNSAASLWGSNYDFFHPTSIIPNAAFKAGKYFNGPFNDVLSRTIFRREFENGFVTTFAQLAKKPFVIAMGPVVDEAMKWCIANGAVAASQYLGYLPHPSGNAGSQFSYFMRKKRIDDLKPKDPVRHRAADLDAAYFVMAQNVRERLDFTKS
ncbi:MAG: hypothetical protein NUV55_08665 [Sulfuricaulis sp.]|uniref:hypothetical protein n=1 Tax=Sulfuricaulis sp. TaxID=2003553 RepID=UPI0025CCBCA1|nr:hypothetical protein [Sulfuricaulis sp.]MCR4347254.1 hypothetical protein [Sulfuricaulis sp.]